MAISAIRTVIIYIFIIAAMRIMGKRQLGELQPVELVVTLLISDLAAVPMQESGMPLLNGLIPIVVLVALELLLSGLMLKSSGFSKLISGNPIVIIRDGKLDQKALKRLRLTVEDLMETLRQQNAFDIREIEYAIAETNGKNQPVHEAGLPSRHRGRRQGRFQGHRRPHRGRQRWQTGGLGPENERPG